MDAQTQQTIDMAIDTAAQMAGVVASIDPKSGLVAEGVIAAAQVINGANKLRTIGIISPEDMALIWGIASGNAKAARAAWEAAGGTAPVAAKSE